MYFHIKTLSKCWRNAIKPDNISGRHLFFITVFPLLFMGLRTFVWCVRKLDYLFFPDFRKQPVKSPIFIIGNPRSGTTVTHRLMSCDDRFTYFKLVDTIFPAIFFYKIFDLLGKTDQRLGSPVARIINRFSDQGFSGWNHIHKTGPLEAESDEMLFVYTLLSPLTGLLFPYFEALPEAMVVDRLPEAKRDKLMAYYLNCLKRHLYATGPDKILLEKVALIAGRLRSVLQTFPDIRLVHLVRHPYQSIPSLISMFAVPWKTMAPKAANKTETFQALAEIIFTYYKRILEIKKTLPAEQLLEIHYDDLTANPQAAVERIYHHFQIPISGRYDQFLAEASNQAQHYKSHHHYTLEEFGLSRQQVYTALKDVFEAYGFKP